MSNDIITIIIFILFFLFIILIIFVSVDALYNIAAGKVLIRERACYDNKNNEIIGVQCKECFVKGWFGKEYSVNCVGRGDGRKLN